MSTLDAIKQLDALIIGHADDGGGELVFYRTERDDEVGLEIPCGVTREEPREVGDGIKTSGLSVTISTSELGSIDRGAGQFKVSIDKVSDSVWRSIADLYSDGLFWHVNLN